MKSFIFMLFCAAAITTSGAWWPFDLEDTNVTESHIGQSIEATTEVNNVTESNESTSKMIEPTSAIEESSTIETADVTLENRVGHNVEATTEVKNATESSSPATHAAFKMIESTSAIEKSSTTEVTNVTDSRVGRSIEATTEINNATESNESASKMIKPTSAIEESSTIETADVTLENRVGHNVEATTEVKNATESNGPATRDVSKVIEPTSAIEASSTTEVANVTESRVRRSIEATTEVSNATEIKDEELVVVNPESVVFTRAGSAANPENATESAKTCKAHALCYKDKDCGEKGRCLGIFVGKCNCNACLNLLSCTADTACGGLRNACNTTSNRCDCFAGHKANGFPLFIDALRELCNVKDCDAKTDTCFGLPCNSGRCVC